MKRTQAGLTLVEIAIAVTIAGFVAAFALPSWRQHTVREQVAAIVAAADPAKATVEEHVARTGELPSTTAISLPFITSRQVLASTWAASGTTGTVTVSTSPTGGRDEPALDAKAIVLTATLDAPTRELRWTCGGTPATTIDVRFLPENCR